MGMGEITFFSFQGTKKNLTGAFEKCKKEEKKLLKTPEKIEKYSLNIRWIKNMFDKQTWDFQLLNSDEFSDDLLLELLGNRQGVLFVEGTADKSIDRKLYS